MPHVRLLLSILLVLNATNIECLSADEPEQQKAYADFAAQPGNQQAGKKFFESDRATCTKCHIVGGTTRSAGPDLLGIADKYNRQQLIEAVLKPNAALLPDYATTIVFTTAGKTHSGILRKRNAEEIQLMDDKGKLLRIPNEQIDQVTKSEISLMPENMHKLMTREEFRDLISYLASLKLPKLDSDAQLKIAENIRELKEPVRLIPFHTEAMKFDLPVWMVAIPGTTDQFYVLEQRTDKIWRFTKNEKVERKDLFLDISGESSEGTFEGLVCMALHPEYTKNGKYYLNHNTRGPNKEFGTAIIERTALPDLTRDSGKPTRHLLDIPQNTDVHPGGMIGFGPDGYLFISTGDGGPQKDPEGRAQNLAILSGSLLRVDVDSRMGDLPYGIPKDNPYLHHQDKTIRKEVWAHGFRNLWRFSWDRLTNDMWIGDVGQNRYEEITIARKGENHGWNIYEGFGPHSEAFRDKNATYVPPVFAYPRNLGVSVTGGYVYRGKRSASFQGVYIFADYESKRIWGLTQSNRRLVKVRQIGKAPQRVASFAEDNAGEIYAIGYEGTIYHVNLDDAVFE